MSEELPVYLDHAAATPLDPEVAAVMAEVQATTFANPSSPHASGRAARRVLEESRERILAAFGGRGVDPDGTRSDSRPAPGRPTTWRATASAATRAR